MKSYFRREIDFWFERCSSMWVEVVVAWIEQLGSSAVTAYEVGFNGNIIARTRLDQGEGRAEIDYINFAHPVLAAGTATNSLELSEAECVANGVPIGSSLVFEEPIRSFEEALRAEAGEEFSPSGERLRIHFWGRRESALPLWQEMMYAPALYKEPDFFVLKALSRMIVGPGEMVRDALMDFRYLGPIRSMPPRSFEPCHNDPGRWATGLAAWDALHEPNVGFVEKVNKWLSERLKSGYTVRQKTFRVIETERLPADAASHEEVAQFVADLKNFPVKTQAVLVADGQSIELRPQDLGTGISQLLPAVVLALNPPPSGLVAMEQPELHLHPALQTELGDLFIESALGEYPNTFILETHSEHLILRLLRRIRETSESRLPSGVRPLRPDQISVLYVESGEQGVKLSQLRIDESGEFIDRWPKGFFEERVDEIL